MIDVKLLGRGGTYPLPGRFLTALMFRYQGKYTLVDCGEGTQVAIRVADWGFRNIHRICITHFHGDHISGLPGLLLTIGNTGRTEPIQIIGPKGLAHVVNSLCVIASELPFPVEFVELTEDYHEIELEDFVLTAQRVEHRVPCYGYSFYLPRIGKFNTQKAHRLQIPREYWSYLQEGKEVVVDGKKFTPAQVLGPRRKGIRLTYTTDLRPSRQVVELAKDSDLFVCEGVYGDYERKEIAILHQHCMFQEAAQMAKEAKVKELWLTHFSPALKDPWEHLPETREIFPATFIDRNHAVLSFGNHEKVNIGNICD